MIPWGRTDKRTNGRTNGQTDGRTNICSLFRDKLSLPEGSLDFFEAIIIHKNFCGKKEVPQPSISLLNKTNIFDGYDFNINIITDEVNALQKESLMLFEGFCIFGYREFCKNVLCILMEVNKTIYENNGDVPDKLLDIFLLRSPGIRNNMNQQVRTPDPVFP